MVVDELAVNVVNVWVLYWIDTFKSKSRAVHPHFKTNVMRKLLKEFNANNIYLPADITEVKNYKESAFISNELHK